MEFAVKMIDYACDCGTKTPTVKVGVSCFGELVAFWDCPKCQVSVVCRIPMERLITKIPPLPQHVKLLAAPPVYTEEDVRLLTKMHISLKE